MVRLLLVIVFVHIGFKGVAQTCPTSGNFKSTNGGGTTWSNSSDWLSPGAPTYTIVNNTITIPAGQVVIVESSGMTFPAGVSLVIEGTLVVNGKLSLSAGTSISVSSGGYVCCNSPNCNSASERLNIGGSNVWNGSNGPVSGPAFTDGTGPLPIELLYFNVSIPRNESRTFIEWATSSEENFSHFEIQRAGKDLQFSTLLEVPGAGYNTNSLNQYETYDENPLVGVGYYRLKAVDIDGTVEYFNVKSVNYNGGRRMLIMPNPTLGASFKYSINWEPGAFDRVTLIDPVGNELYSAPVTATQNEIVLNSSLRPGAYLLRYTSSTFQQVARVFIKN